MSIRMLVVLIIGFSPAALAWEASSYAFVKDDGTLTLRGRTIHLFGISIPPTDRICRGQFRPVRCAPRAVLELDFKVGRRFVHCAAVEENPDRSLVAVCQVDGEDLAAYLLERGWAVALPDAPPEYVTLEKIASQRGVGVWGIPVDSIKRPSVPRPHSSGNPVTR